MDQRYEILNNEAFVFVELKRFRDEKRKLESIEPPKKEVKHFEQWRLGKEQAWKSEMGEVARSIIQESVREVESVYSDESFQSSVERCLTKHVQKALIPSLKLQYLPLLAQQMEEVFHSLEMIQYQQRFGNIPESISRLEGRAKTIKFSPDQINVAQDHLKRLRFPAERCQQKGDQYADMWLSEFLKSKPIPFDSRDYSEKLVEFRQKIYLPLWEREQEEKRMTQQSPPVEEKKYSPPPNFSTEDMAEFDLLPKGEEGSEDGGFFSRSSAKILTGKR